MRRKHKKWCVELLSAHYGNELFGMWVQAYMPLTCGLLFVEKPHVKYGFFHRSWIIANTIFITNQDIVYILTLFYFIFSSKNIPIYTQTNLCDKSRKWVHVQPEVIGSIPLAKTTSWDYTDPSFLQQFEAVQHIWCHGQGLQKHRHRWSCGDLSPQIIPKLLLLLFGAAQLVDKGVGEKQEMQTSRRWRNRLQTWASWIARGGMKIWGKAYIAPWTGLHLMPGTEFKISSVSLALWARASRTELFSWGSK